MGFDFLEPSSKGRSSGLEVGGFAETLEEGLARAVASGLELGGLS
jgi:hypothetical protein